MEPAYQCCFCGSRIRAQGHDPVTLTITISDEEAAGESQELRCHADCLRRRIQPGIATLMDAHG